MINRYHLSQLEEALSSNDYTGAYKNKKEANNLCAVSPLDNLYDELLQWSKIADEHGYHTKSGRKIAQKIDSPVEKVAEETLKLLTSYTQQKEAIKEILDSSLETVDSVSSFENNSNINGLKAKKEAINACISTFNKAKKQYKKKVHASSRQLGHLSTGKKVFIAAMMVAGFLAGGLIGLIAGTGTAALIGAGAGSVVPAIGTVSVAITSGSIGGVVGAVKGAVAGSTLAAGVGLATLGISTIGCTWGSKKLSRWMFFNSFEKNVDLTTNNLTKDLKNDLRTLKR